MQKPAKTDLVVKKQKISKKNAVPLLDKEAFHKSSKEPPFLKITKTDAIIVAVFLGFLLIIALIVFFVTWVANMVFKMQRDHLDQIK